MLLWQPEGFYKECWKSWYRHNLVQNENSEARLWAVAFRFLMFSFPLLPLLLSGHKLSFGHSCATWRDHLQLLFHARAAPMGALPHPFQDKQQIPSIPAIQALQGLFTQNRWESIRMSNSTSSSEHSHLWEKGGEDKWGWCYYSFIQNSCNQSGFLLCVCLSLWFRGLFGSPVFLIWLQMLWVVRQIFEVRVLKDG